MAQKIVISKPGFDVLSETDPNNLIFSSDYDTLKYFLLGTVNLTFNFADYYHVDSTIFGDVYYYRKVVEVTHGLGYTPYFTGYLKDFPSSGQHIQCPFFFGDFIYFEFLSVFADSNKLYFLLLGNGSANSGSTSIDFEYRIFLNNLGL